MKFISEMHPAYCKDAMCNVDSVMFVSRIREMASFELGKEIKKDVFRLVMSVGQGKGNILYYHGFANQKILFGI